MAKCYPKIKDYCREKHGLEFQVSVLQYPVCKCQGRSSLASVM